MMLSESQPYCFSYLLQDYLCSNGGFISRMFWFLLVDLCCCLKGVHVNLHNGVHIFEVLILLETYEIDTYQIDFFDKNLLKISIMPPNLNYWYLVWNTEVRGYAGLAINS